MGKFVVETRMFTFSLGEYPKFYFLSYPFRIHTWFIYNVDLKF